MRWRIIVKNKQAGSDTGSSQVTAERRERRSERLVPYRSGQRHRAGVMPAHAHQHKPESQEEQRDDRADGDGHPPRAQKTAQRDEQAVRKRQGSGSNENSAHMHVHILTTLEDGYSQVNVASSSESGE
jgi:hypothetical protein